MKNKRADNRARQEIIIIPQTKWAGGANNNKER